VREPTVSGLRKLGARFLKDESGATAIEYAIIAGMLSIAIATAVTAVGTSVNTMFTKVETALQ
jgi:pilus assembly protein Flp/PilA